MWNIFFQISHCFPNSCTFTLWNFDADLTTVILPLNDQENQSELAPY